MNPSSPPSSIRRRPPQISLRTMMLLMIVCSVTSAGFFYASWVPAIQDEFSVMVKGRSGGTDEQGGRLAQIVFIMFTVCSPLVLATVLSTSLTIRQWFERRA